VSEAILFTEKRETKRKRKRALNVILWTFIVALICLALLELVFALFISPTLIVKHIHVDCDFAISESEVMSIAGLGPKEYYFRVNAEELQERLAAYPVVSEARVVKVFPDTLRIVLRRRTPLALAFGMLEHTTVPVAFDAEGVIFQIGKSVTDWNLPVVSGLIFKPLMGLRLPRKLFSLLTAMHELKQKEPQLFNLISEIKVVAVNEIDYELIFYPVGYNVKVNLGDRFDESLLKYTLMVLDVLKRQKAAENVQELDFRTGEVVYKIPSEEG
jgi:cell division protein FtsQ